MTVSLARRNAPINPECRIYAPRFPKPQTEGFFLIVCSATSNGGDGELLGLKRVSWPPVAKRNGNGNGKDNSGAGSSRGGASNDKNKSGLTVRSSVKFPEGILAQSSSATTANKARVNIKVISDSYVGMVWTVSNVEVDLDSGIETQLVAESSVPTKE
jgi:antiviral helicase SLH1